MVIFKLGTSFMSSSKLMMISNRNNSQCNLSSNSTISSNYKSYLWSWLPMRCFRWVLTEEWSRWSRIQSLLIAFKRLWRLNSQPNSLLKNSFRSTTLTIWLRPKKTLWRVWQHILWSCIWSKPKTGIMAIFCCIEVEKHSTLISVSSSQICQEVGSNCKKIVHSSCYLNMWKF